MSILCVCFAREGVEEIYTHTRPHTQSHRQDFQTEESRQREPVRPITVLRVINMPPKSLAERKAEVLTLN